MGEVRPCGVKVLGTVSIFLSGIILIRSFNALWHILFLREIGAHVNILLIALKYPAMYFCYILFFIAGVGIIFFRNWARGLILAMSPIIALTILWMVPPVPYVNLSPDFCTTLLERSGYSQKQWLLMFTFWLTSVFALIYLHHPKIKEQFF